MPQSRDVRGLRLYSLIGQIVSILMGLAGLVAISLFFDPTIMGIAAKNQSEYRGQSFFLIFGVGFVGLAIWFGVVFTRWSRRLLWIWRNTMPTPMDLSIKIVRSMDSTSYEAILQVAGRDERDWIVGLYSPLWPIKDLHSLQDRTIRANVYFEPKSQRPAVIETELGLLWAMAGRSACRS
jgi:hypothetical protein